VQQVIGGELRANIKTFVQTQSRFRSRGGETHAVFQATSVKNKRKYAKQ